MDFKKLEEALFEDEDFLRFLPLLMEKNWKKAKPTQRMRIFDEIQRVVSETDNKYPSLIGTEKFDEDEKQAIIFAEEYTLFNRSVFAKTINPYDIISNYFFELALCDMFERVKEDDDFVQTEVGKKIFVNCTVSKVGTFDNYYNRKSDKFFLQPIVRESVKITRKITLDILKYMNNEYGMDEYIGNTVSNIMASSFNQEKLDKETEENYKKMLDNMVVFENEMADLSNLNDYMNSIDLNNISKEELYSFFNVKIMNVLEWQTVSFLFKKFVEKELEGYELCAAVVNTVGIGIDEDEDVMFLAANGERYQIDSYVQGFYHLVCFLANVKLSEGLDTGVEDEKLVKDAKECYDYMFELRNEKGLVECDYLPSGFSYEEYKNRFLKLYYKKIEKAIENSKFFRDGAPALYSADFSKFEAYLRFAFDMGFEEVKEKQFNALKENYNKKIGGSR